MTTSSRRSVDFRDEPEIINDTESQFEEHETSLCDDIPVNNTSNSNNTIVEVHVNGTGPDNNYDHKPPRENVKTYISELHIDVLDHQEKETKVLIGEPEKNNILVGNSSQKSSQEADKTQFNPEKHVGNSNIHVTIEHPCYSTNTQHSHETASRDSDSCDDSLGSLSDMSQVSSDFIENPSPQPATINSTDNESCLSYTSFPGNGNFILVKANDWLKNGCRYDQDGFALQSNFGHVDMKSKPISRPWLSQFRKMAQRVYVTPHGKVVENISIQDHDGRSYITSYHTNKELKSFEPSSHQKSNHVTEEVSNYLLTN
jgi:phenylpyruvate tautomerase PptA (4-oxalocrotonate tautomerase family)